ncbi:hypothetical protein CONLIGDRAFT_648940 [Coniochaeta ligniaria NRRL 30616]|uniref:Uncharacterized protein n=1 Tax=Coniochaeta ligniaria NRRL 30616 TaxID=1408157 RepID=A0A1J7ISR9_9PEZI|nr:hypothetical protein CONLIGDRAFT_648940 [Coniochaeta ligniaria NRRL 30616]
MSGFMLCDLCVLLFELLEVAYTLRRSVVITEAIDTKWMALLDQAAHYHMAWLKLPAKLTKESNTQSELNNRGGTTASSSHSKRELRRVSKPLKKLPVTAGGLTSRSELQALPYKIIAKDVGDG